MGTGPGWQASCALGGHTARPVAWDLDGRTYSAWPPGPVCSTSLGPFPMPRSLTACDASPPHLTVTGGTSGAGPAAPCSHPAG